MSLDVQLCVAQSAVPTAFYDAIARLEVQESSDRPGVLLLELPANRTSAGDLQFVGDGTFEPMTSITLTVTPSAAGAAAQCIFDGYALSWRLHLDRTSTASRLEIWAQDASLLMNLDDKVLEWSGQTDGEIANTIFESYGFSAAEANTNDDSPIHDPDGHTLFQRSTDLQLLRGLARRGGKQCRVGCTDTPGQRTGYFVQPSLDAAPVTTISLVDPTSWTVDRLDLDWDVMRPTEVDASQVDLSQSSDTGTDVSAASSGLDVLAQRDYASYFGQSSTFVLTAPADVADLSQRATAVLADSGFFVRCSGEADAERLGTVLRVGDVVALAGAGSLHSGNWLVWDVRHSYALDSWKMAFTLVRNAMGPPAAAGSLSSFAGSLAAPAGVPTP
ncbi:MAG TPA: hypothetical protein VMD59_06825 [Acidimicrobiales bacterium]|nr:hypothetical protein [Acidimicrobiales bacterium]